MRSVRTSHACNFQTCGNESQQGLQPVEKLSTPLSDDQNLGLNDKKSSHFEVDQLNGWIFSEAPFLWRNVDGWKGRSPTRDTLLGEPTFHTFPYCAFQKHANSEVQMPPSQLRFTLPSIIITITRNKPWNTGTHKTDRQSQTMTFWTRWSKLLFPKRSAKMIDGSEER